GEILYVLERGLCALEESWDDFKKAILDPGGELACRSANIVRQHDPEAGIQFVETESGYKFICEGQFGPQVQSELRAEFESFLSKWPHFREAGLAKLLQSTELVGG